MNGFFAGGMAEGMLESRKMGLAERTNEQDVGLRTRALDINEKQFGAEQARKENTRLDEHIANTMNIVSETIKAGLEGGKDPNALAAVVQPLVQSAQQIAMKAGRNPDALAAQVQAQLFQPTPVGRAAVAGEAAATQAVSQDAAERKLLLQQQPATPGQPEPELKPRYKTQKEKAEVEKGLRDDYQTQSKRFVEARDAYQGIAGLPKDPKSRDWATAEDLALTFAFLKMNDPGSIASPGEQAAVRNNGSFADKIAILNNQVRNEGAALGPDVRAGLRARAEALWKARSEQQTKLTNSFEGIATRSGVNAKNVIVDFNSVPVQPSAPAARPDPLNIR